MPGHDAGARSPVFQFGSLNSIPGQSEWDLWYTKELGQVSFPISPVNIIPLTVGTERSPKLYNLVSWERR
jgi:hypothetical protein